MFLIKIPYKLYQFLKQKWIRRSSDSLLNYYRKKGCKIGDGTIAFDPKSLLVDVTRPSLIEIGENVFLHKGLTLLTHDFASWTFVRVFDEFLPSSGKITIGNNVWFGYNCTVLKGITIGDNCIIGIGSVVTKDIPSNSVAVGVPAKVVCTLEEYFEKRKKEYVMESIDYAKSIKERFNREPIIEDFITEDYTCFVDGSNIDDYPMINFQTVLKGNHFNRWKENYKAPFHGFESFMDAVNKTNYK